MTAGRLITLEGIDGCGKTTQVALLQQYLSQRGFAIEATREPGGTMLAEAIRCLLLEPRYGPVEARAEVFLYAAARAQHVAERILPALQAGKLVICDRYVDSSIAYQGYGRELGAGLVRQVNDLATGGLRPDLTLVLDVAAEVGLERRRGQTVADRLEQEDLAFYRRVRQGYRELAAQEPERVRLINASEPPPAVWLQIKKVVDALTEFAKG